MATPLNEATYQMVFPSGMPKVVTRFREEDDIMYVTGLDGVEHIVWSDHRLRVYSRYDTHSYYHEWREKEYEGDPRPPRVKEYWDYHPSVEDAFRSALQAQDELLSVDKQEVPIFLNER